MPACVSGRVSLRSCVGRARLPVGVLCLASFRRDACILSGRLFGGGSPEIQSGKPSAKRMPGCLGPDRRGRSAAGSLPTGPFPLCAGAGAASRGPGRDPGAAPALPLPLAAARQAPRPHLPRPLERLVRPSAGGDHLGHR